EYSRSWTGSCELTPSCKVVTPSRGGLSRCRVELVTPSPAAENIILRDVGVGIDVCVYASSDHAGDYIDRKRTSGVCTLVGECLTQWCCKKQTALAISTTEAEYVSAGRACQQALCMKQAIKDYETHCEDILVLCDNKDQTTWNQAEREISLNEVLEKEEEENLIYGEIMAYKSYLSTKRQHRESQANMGVMKNYMKRWAKSMS
ncbi:hypothetical protein Tco_0775517, partial [Tanacetum coccineum]